MGLSFIRPYFLVLLIIFIAGIIYSSRYILRMQKNKKKMLVILRCTTVALLVLAFCGTSIYWKLNTTTTLFLIDASDSTKNSRADMEAFIKEAIKSKSSRDKIGVISFGDNTQVESFVSKDISFSKIEGKINLNYTNIENALTSALTLFPGNTNKRIVLLSDGEENLGLASKIAPSIIEQGIDFKYHKIDKISKDEVYVEGISVPEKLNIDEEFNVVVTINSTISQGAKLNLYTGREKTGEQRVQLQKGINKFVFRDKATVGGLKTYKVLIEGDTDSETKNNEAATFTNVVAKPKILVLEDAIGEADELSKMLKASSVDFTLVNAKSAPTTLQEMTSYKSIITCNVSADSLNQGFINSLESYVKDFGGGFIATGGDNSFALGGYAKTPIEKVLPVYMDMRGKKEIPKMAMVLIIDKSGSMTEGIAGISKVDMAKEAAIRSLESLRVDKDEIGVISFDGVYSFVVKKQVIKDVKTIEDDIATIRADGGTSILPALQEGYNALKDSDAKIKHIILLTDGQAERTGYDNLFKEINDNNITVSTVAVGKDADKQLLEGMANSCGGRYYVTDEYTNIPKIFSKETFMAARMYLNNREFTPIINSDHSILNGVAEGGVPKLLGYVGATGKETARVILRSDEDDPVLTAWQYGLGKAVAWNSDISGKWSSNYIPWNKNIKLWQNIINFTASNYQSEGASIEMTQQGSKAQITLKNSKGEEEIDATATVVSPSGETSEVKLYPTAPGQYSSSIDLKESGVYMINGKASKNGDIVSAISTGYALNYSPEYKININGDNIDKVVKEIGGVTIKEPKEVFNGEAPQKKGQIDLTDYLIALALIIFMADIALRRLNISTNKIKALITKGETVVTSYKDTYMKKGKKNEKVKVSTYGNLENIKEEDINDKNIEIVENQIPKVNESSNKNLESVILDTSNLLKNKRFKN